MLSLQFYFRGRGIAEGLENVTILSGFLLRVERYLPALNWTIFHRVCWNWRRFWRLRWLGAALSHCRTVGGAAAIVARMLKRLGGIFKSFKLGDYWILPPIARTEEGESAIDEDATVRNLPPDLSVVPIWV